MALEAGDILERLAIMTVDGGLSDLEAMRLLLKRWPLGRGTFRPWNIAMRRADNLAADARALFEAARESAAMMARLQEDANEARPKRALRQRAEDDWREK